ncbi:hypothetical protein BURK1_03212 [Burkholderiales bacterium]|nr:hypothetical protein BURK1_03212 [Burkholderiales bacterium]
MTNGRDDVRDRAVDRVWREHAGESPSAALDDAIRAAARRAIGAGPQGKAAVAEAREPWRWWMPLAAAATIGAIAIGVIQNLPQDAAEPMVVSDESTATTATARTAPESIAPAPPADAEPSAAGRAAESPPAVQRTAPAGRPREARPRQAPAPPIAPPFPRMQSPIEGPATRQDTVPPTAGRQGAEAPAASKAAPVAAKPAAESTRQSADDVPSQTTAIAKRREADAPAARKDERAATTGFAASPPASPPQPVAAAAPAPASRVGAVASLAGARDAGAGSDTAPRARLEASDASATQRAVVAQGAPARSTEAFIAAIRRLLAAGDADGAARELRAFRQAHADADARLPVELRPWAAGVSR